MRAALLAIGACAGLFATAPFACAQAVVAKPAAASDKVSVQPAPRLADGKVDLGGKGVWAPIWVLDWADKKYVEENIDVPMTPAGAELYKERQANHSKDDPEGYCLPAGVPR